MFEGEIQETLSTGKPETAGGRMRREKRLSSIADPPPAKIALEVEFPLMRRLASD